MDDRETNISQLTSELEESKKQNKRLLDLLDNSRDMLYRMSLPDGKYEYVSPSSVDIFGYTPKEIYDSPLLIRDIVHPDWREYFKSQWRLLISGEMPPTYEYQIIHKSGETRWINQNNYLICDSAGNPEAIEGSVRDITDQKMAEEALDRRILALTRPLDDIKGLDFEEIFNLGDIQQLQDEFALATGVGSIITHADGTPITAPSNFCRLCANVIRKTKQGFINCCKSDAELGQFNPDGPIIQQCMSAGLWGAGAAISIEGRHIANWVIGQVRDETQTEASMREYARIIDADEAVFLEAFRKVPAMSKEQFERIARTLFTIANQLSAYAYQNVQQARFISELKQKETELRENEARLQEYQQMAHLGHWLWDIKTGDVTWSEDVFKTFKLDPSEFTPQIDSIMALSPWPGERDRHQELIQIATQSHSSGSFEQRFLRPDGSSGYYASTFQGIYDDDDNLIAIKGTVQDITERKRAEEALKESETHLRTLVHTIPDLVWLKDPEGIYLSCNPRFENFFGAKESDIIGKTDYDFVNKSLADYFRINDNLAIAQKKPVRNEEKVTFANDGHVEILETIKTPMYRSNGELAGVLGIGRDITNRRLAEEQLQIRERMDSIGTLASGIAHDFNNLLVGIMGNLDLLRMDSERFSPDQSDCLNESYELSQKAARLIGSLLSLSNSTASEITSVDIYKVAKDVLAILSRTTDRLIEKKLDMDPGVFTINSQHDQMHQVFLNLGKNAIQAIEEKGVQPGDYIKISASDCNSNEAAKRGLRPNKCVHVVFEDTGIGMTEEVRRRAFEPLFSTKERGAQKGQGLGLAMVYNIITRSNNGAIDIESAPGNGTKFHIFLPKTEMQASSVSAYSAEIQGGNETILIIEDEESVIKLAEKALSKYGYSVFTAADGIAGFQAYKEKQNDIDLVILDITLPKMSGEMVLEKILSLNPKAKIIISSGQITHELNTHTRIKGFVPKPYKLSNLIKTVRDALDT